VRPRVIRDLLRFHLAVGARLALNRLAPVAALGLAAFYLFRPDFFTLMVSEVDKTGGLLLGALFFLVSGIFAAMAAPRVFLGLRGWIRHLPVSSMALRLTAQAGVLVSLTPVLAALGFLYVLSVPVLESSPVVFVLGLPVLGWAASQLSLPVKRRWIVRPLALGAGILAASGRELFLALALIPLVTAEAVSGPLSGRTKPLPWSSRGKSRGLPWLILGRALRWRLLSAYLISLPPFVLTYAYLSNNPATPLQQQRASLFGTAAAVVVCAAVTAHQVALRRPDWPWLRSLPETSRSRILRDAGFLGLHALPVYLPLVLWDARAFLFLAAGLPALFVYAAAAVRRAPESRMSAWGLILICGIFGGMIVTVLPWAALAFLAAVPLLLRYAESLERGQKVSRWLEFHHLAAGDPHSWSVE
jgi:hypothetical protein